MKRVYNDTIKPLVPRELMILSRSKAVEKIKNKLSGAVKLDTQVEMSLNQITSAIKTRRKIQ
jgi:hypothetical protein